MTSSQGFTVTIERAWKRLMFNMGHTNHQRARDAQKAAAALTSLMRRN